MTVNQLANCSAETTYLLFIHGYPLDSTMWENQLQSLPPEVRPLAIDLAGFGRNSSNDGANFQPGQTACSMASYAEECAQFLNHHKIFDPVVICGLSMGGYVALEFWKRYPNRVKAMILCDTRAAADTVEGVALRKSIADRALREGTEVVVKPMLDKLLCETSRVHKPLVVQRLFETMMKVPSTTIHAAQNAMADRADFTARLSEIRVPSLLIVGEKDAISTPEEMRSMADKIPHSQLVVIPDAGHLPPIENAIVFNAEIVRFLSKVI